MSDGPALQIRVSLDGNLETAVAGLEAALVCNACKVAVDLALAEAEAARGARADRHTAAKALLAALEGAGVLQAVDGQMATNFGGDLFRLGERSLERGVAARLQDELPARLNMAIGVGHVVSVGIAAGGAGTEGDAETTAADVDADRAAHAVVG